jgi:hypothetical protein
MRQNKTLSIVLFVLIAACSKQVVTKRSNELLIDVVNACNCTILIRENSTGATQKETWDCIEATEIPVIMEKGFYRITAEGEGKRKEIFFQKTNIAQTLTIEL